MMHFRAFALNLLALLSFGMSAYAIQPNGRKKVGSTRRLNSFSYGISPSNPEAGLREIMYAAASIASPQNDLGSPDSMSMEVAWFTRVAFILSAIPFCSGVSAAVV